MPTWLLILAGFGITAGVFVVVPLVAWLVLEGLDRLPLRK